MSNVKRTHQVDALRSTDRQLVLGHAAEIATRGLKANGRLHPGVLVRAVMKDYAEEILELFEATPDLMSTTHGPLVGCRTNGGVILGLTIGTVLDPDLHS